MCYTTVAQKSKKFKEGVEIITLEKVENYQTPRSILIEFTGHTHSIHFYLDLAKKLKRKLNRKSIKVNFNYTLSAPNSFQTDLDLIPKDRYKAENYNVLFHIGYKGMESWSSRSLDSNRQNIKLHSSLLKDNNVQIIAILDVNTYKTILTQNRKVSNLLVKILTEN